MPSRRGSIVKVSPFVPAAVETTVKPALAVKPAPAELAVAFAKLKTAKPDFPSKLSATVVSGPSSEVDISPNPRALFVLFL